MLVANESLPGKDSTQFSLSLQLGKTYILCIASYSVFGGGYLKANFTTKTVPWKTATGEHHLLITIYLFFRFIEPNGTSITHLKGQNLIVSVFTFILDRCPMLFKKNVIN